MKYKFIQCAKDIGLRFAVHTLRAHNVSITVMQLWCGEAKIKTTPEQLRNYYYE